MGSKDSTFPDMNWFEFEVLSQLMWEDRYGNQILQVLEERLGSDVVYSGKVYPALQRLEKKGFIERKKLTGKGASARGVDPIYYSLTKKGSAELKKTTMHTVIAFFEGVLATLRYKVAERALELIAESQEPPYKAGIAILGSVRQVGEDAMKMLNSFEDLEPILIMVDGLCGKCSLCMENLPGTAGMMTMRAAVDDVPLKDDYLDVLAAVTLYKEGKEWEDFMREALRTVRPGGLVLMVEFGKFNSYILEEIMNSIHKHSGAACNLEELDEATLTVPLKGILKDVKSERLKEMLLVYGTKA
jgi:DNA-binding PadR family transcriptional regulator